MNRGSWSSRSSSTAAAAQQHSSSGGGDVELLFLVPAPRVKPERQMKKMEHRSGIFSGLSAYYALRISIADRAPRCIADRGTTEAAAQQQQHSSSSTAAVVAATSRLRTKRTSVDTPVSLLFRSCAFAQFEKDESGHTAKSFVNQCCFTVPLNTLRSHARQQYICSDFVFLSLSRTSRDVVREFHRASSERVFPRLLPLSLVHI